jgi:hypothetical protein
MAEVLCLAALLFANLWGTRNLGEPSNTDKGLLGGALVGGGVGAVTGQAPMVSRGGAQNVQVPDGGTVIIGARKFTVNRETYGPPVLARIPYLNRLFTTVGYSTSESRGAPGVRVGVDFEALTPVPVQPWIAAQPMERAVPADARTPILPPLRAGEKPTCCEPPSHEMILRALPRVNRGVPYLCEVFRDDLEIIVEKLHDKVDAPRFFPLIGPAQLHHCHWKCTVYFTETIDSAYPFSFRTKRRRAEVVYIDTDHLHLCQAAPTVPAADWCAGGRLAPKDTAKNVEPQQVQFSVALGLVDQAAVPEATYRWSLKQFGFENERASCCVVKNRTTVFAWLHALTSDGFAKNLAEPRVITLSGQPASILSGGEVPVVTTDSAGLRHVSYKTVGTQLNVRPTILPDGSIRLDVDATVTTLKKSSTDNDEKATPEFDTQCVQVAAKLESGQTLLARGLTTMEEGKKRELIVVITPEIVNAAHGVITTARPQRVPAPSSYRLEPADDVFVEIDDAYPWQYLHGKYTISPDGSIDLGQIYGKIRVAGLTTSDAQAAIRKGLAPIMKNTFTVRVVPVRPVSDEFLAHYNRKTRTDDGAAEASEPRVVQRVVAAAPQTMPTRLTVSDVVSLTRAGASDDIILRQMELTQSTFRVTTPDLLHLLESGVSHHVIRAMQERRDGAVVPVRR